MLFTVDFPLTVRFFPNLGNFPLLKEPSPFKKICKKRAAMSTENFQNSADTAHRAPTKAC